VDISVAHNATVVVTGTGDVFAWGPSQHLLFQGNKPKLQARPKRVPGIAQASKVHAGHQHTLVSVSIMWPPPLNCKLSCGGRVPSLQSLCEDALSRRIRHRTLLPALSWSLQHGHVRLASYCVATVLANLPLFLPKLLRELVHDPLMANYMLYSRTCYKHAPSSILYPRIMLTLLHSLGRRQPFCGAAVPAPSLSDSAHASARFIPSANARSAF
jgi:hypothetical protein